MDKLSNMLHDTDIRAIVGIASFVSIAYIHSETTVD